MIRLWCPDYDARQGAAILSLQFRRALPDPLADHHELHDPSPVTVSDSMQDEATYICDARGEEIVIPLDLSQGTSQEYVEDCPVCCRPNLIHVEFDAGGIASVWAEAEQDY